MSGDKMGNTLAELKKRRNEVGEGKDLSLAYGPYLFVGLPFSRLVANK
jgi:hypothetical protein